MSAVLRGSESGWSRHFNTAGVNMELKSWISEDHECNLHATVPRQNGTRGGANIPSILTTQWIQNCLIDPLAFISYVSVTSYPRRRLRESRVQSHRETHFSGFLREGSSQGHAELGHTTQRPSTQGCVVGAVQGWDDLGILECLCEWQAFFRVLGLISD